MWPNKYIRGGGGPGWDPSPQGVGIAWGQVTIFNGYMNTNEYLTGCNIKFNTDKKHNVQLFSNKYKNSHFKIWRNLKRLSRCFKVQGVLKRLSRCFKETFKGILRDFRGVLKRLFRWFKETFEVFKRDFRGVLKRLLRCFKETFEVIKRDFRGV